MPSLATPNITLPTELASGIWKRVLTGSVIAALSGSEPQKFGSSDIMTLEMSPKAEFVAEGGQKSPSEAGFGVKTVKPHKVHVTMRFSDEVQYADEDYQLEVLDTLSEQASIALARALDLGAIHGINPLTGLAAASITDTLNQSTNIVTAGDAADIDIETAAGLIVTDGFAPKGIALDTAYAWKIATARYADGRKKYPELGLGTNVTQLENLAASVSDTVSGSREIVTPSKVLGIVGDWDTLRWGVQRDVNVKKIEFGDPDGQGDLQRQGQIALRAEVIYGWAFLDKNAFSVIKSA